MASTYIVTGAENPVAPPTHLSDGTLICLILRSTGELRVYHFGANHDTPVIVGSPNTGFTANKNADVCRDSADNIYVIGTSGSNGSIVAQAFAKGAGYTWTAKNYLLAPTPPVAGERPRGVTARWCNTGGGTNGAGHIMVIYQTDASVGYSILDAGMLLTAATGTALPAIFYNPTFLTGGAGVDAGAVIETCNLAPDGFGATSGLAATSATNLTLTIGAWSLTSGGALGTNTNITSTFATGAVFGQVDQKHFLLRASSGLWVLLHRSTVTAARIMAARFSSTALLTASVEIPTVTAVEYPGATAAWAPYVQPDDPSVVWCVLHSTSVTTRVHRVSCSVGSGITWGTTVVIDGEISNGYATGNSVACVNQPVGSPVHTQLMVITPTLGLHGGYSTFATGGWTVGSIEF